jgi:hypothetical protein
MRLPIILGATLVISLLAALGAVVAPQFQPEPQPEATTRLRTFGEPVHQRQSTIVTTLVDNFSSAKR